MCPIIEVSNIIVWDLIVLFIVSILLMNGVKRELNGGIISSMTGLVRKTRSRWAEKMLLSFLSLRMSLKLQSTDKSTLVTT
jgi:hypothetical protein